MAAQAMMSVGIGAGLPVRPRVATQTSAKAVRRCALRAPRVVAPAARKLNVVASAKEDTSFEAQVGSWERNVPPSVTPHLAPTGNYGP